ncbi:MAG TPA: Rieske 2Fe-2S domain-containing protein [Candidatus Thermoplasmatota archaeon]|nr:Rieske 2Fe-2S domain-containing protein [Candidatus Thermoplasmatota archaeon]
MAGKWVAVLPLETLRDGGMAEVEAEGRPVLLARQGGEVHASSATCPHKFGPLADGVLEGTRLTCPMHAATFDLTTGRSLPGQEWAGTLQLYPVRIVEGVVEVLVP